MYHKDKSKLSKSYFHNTGLHQSKQAKDVLEAYNTETSLINVRKKLLDDQKKLNYSMEYDRIRGMLENSILPFRTQADIMNRKDELKLLIAKAFSII